MRDLAIHAAQLMTIQARNRRGRPRPGNLHHIPTRCERLVLPSPLQDQGREPAPPPGGELSKRELEVTKLITCGMTNREIAQKLFIAERTAEGHVERIRNKLGVRSRTEVAIWAAKNGLADDLHGVSHRTANNPG